MEQKKRLNFLKNDGKGRNRILFNEKSEWKDAQSAPRMPRKLDSII